MSGETIWILKAAFAIVFAGIVGIYVSRQVRRSGARPGGGTDFASLRWVPHTVVRVLDEAVEVKKPFGRRVRLAIESIAGVSCSSERSIRWIDNSLLGLAFFDAKGRALRLPGVFARETLSGEAVGEVPDNANQLLRELLAKHPGWHPKRVRGFLIYRFCLTIFLVLWLFWLLPIALAWLMNAPYTLQAAAWALFVAASVPAFPILWRLIVRMQLSTRRGT